MHIRVTPKQQRDYIFQSIIKIGPPDQLLIDMQCNKNGAYHPSLENKLRF